MRRRRVFSRARTWCAPVLLLVAVSSCSTADRLAGPEAPDATPNHLLGSGSGLLGTGIGGGLLACPAQPEARASGEIGPAGGSLQVGPHTLVVPPGALAAPVVISAVAPSDPVVSVSFAPEGLTFARPARLTLSYAHCPLLPSLLPKHIAYTTNLLEILQLLTSVDDLLHWKVSAGLDHFSRYAVAW
jgi:hypothetical protein